MGQGNVKDGIKFILKYEMVKGVSWGKERNTPLRTLLFIFLKSWILHVEFGQFFRGYTISISKIYFDI